jgi:hypothetical protein
MRHRMWIACAVAVLAMGVADAQALYVPASYATVVGNAQLNSLVRESTRTVQQGIDASALTRLPAGAEIVGLSFRLYRGGTAAWPAANATWKNYEITLAECAVPPAQWTATFASNMKNPVLVRKGPMTIPAGTFAYTATNPNPFDTFYFAFQRSYVYQGGDLAFLITHDGNDQANTCFLEGLTAATAPGRTMYALSYQASTAVTTSTTFMIARIHYGYGPAGGTGTNGALNLILSNNLVSPTPAPGAINLAITNGAPSAPGGIFISPTPAAVPYSIPGGNKLLIFPAFLAFIPITLDAGGRYDLNLGFPAVSLGVELQAYAVDAANPAGFVVTNAVSFQISP